MEKEDVALCLTFCVGCQDIQLRTYQFSKLHCGFYAWPILLHDSLVNFVFSSAITASESVMLVFRYVLFQKKTDAAVVTAQTTVLGSVFEAFAVSNAGQEARSTDLSSAPHGQYNAEL